MYPPPAGADPRLQSKGRGPRCKGRWSLRPPLPPGRGSCRAFPGSPPPGAPSRRHGGGYRRPSPWPLPPRYGAPPGNRYRGNGDRSESSPGGRPGTAPSGPPPAASPAPGCHQRRRPFRRCLPGCRFLSQPSQSAPHGSSGPQRRWPRGPAFRRSRA